MSSSDRRPLRFDCLRDSVSEVRRLQETGYGKAGEWNLSQACQHLSKTLRMSLQGAPFSLPFFMQPIARFLMHRTVMEGKPTKLKAKAPAAFQPREDTVDNDADITEYEQLVQQIMADDVELIPKHPIFGKITTDEWRKFHAWHAAHHLSFLLPAETPAALATAQQEVH